MTRALPGPQGLYHPENEHDSCGVSFVVDMHGRASHDMVQRGVTTLCNLEHRGATGNEVNTGDGAGILIQLPDRFFRKVVGFDLPAVGAYVTGMAFLPRDEGEADKAATQVEQIVESEGFVVLGWREMPTDHSMIGKMALDAMPSFRQVFFADEGALQEGSSGRVRTGEALERAAYVVRKRVEHEIDASGQDGSPWRVYFPSLSTRVMVYKGMLTTPQLGAFFPDLSDERVESALALVHSRFSTNTFPSWPRAHPYRMVAHNGEINTVKGNRNWMHARESVAETDLIEGDLDKIRPICDAQGSDTASFDETLEFLHMGGYPIHHAVLMMIPEAWERHQQMAPAKKAFYRFHASLMEPWDGPAAVAFTDGSVIGAVLDRNGLRPSRYWVTNDGLVVMASESGVIDVDPADVVEKGRLEPGKMFLVDTVQGRIISDEEIKSELAAEKPYQEWLDEGIIKVWELPDRPQTRPPHSSVLERQMVFGYTHEEIKILIEPMARTGAEAIGSMGTDTPLAVLSDRPRLLFDYFAQLFAQVTNPPLDGIREELVTALGAAIGPEGNIFDPGPHSCEQVVLPQPILTNDELAKLEHIHDTAGQEDDPGHGFIARVISCLYPVAEGGAGLVAALDRCRAEASAAVQDGVNIIILSDRHSTSELAPIPSLLFTGAVHHHLVREKTRTQVGMVVEAGDAREVHHMALLLGYGASGINPYLALETIGDLIAEGHTRATDQEKAVALYIKACGKGMVKIASKMGISTGASYHGAQIFEAMGIGSQVVDDCFTGTTSRLGGIGYDEIAEEVARRHRSAHPDRPEERAHRTLDIGGEYQWRREGEHHLFNPDTIYKLQHSTRTGRYEIFKEYTRLINDQSERLATLRGLFSFAEGRTPIPIDEVEPASEIVKRFSTGAMSYGSISAEAHETLAIAMNNLGAKSNTGEGGENPERFLPLPDGTSKRSAIKQVASGRFGVTSEYLTNADDIQIKMAQGAKPGEGGQLPGHKVYPWIAKVRYSTPGVGLISPPPHHDIYSIEDLAQLIHDLKNANPSARVHVKLVAEVGVGTVATGVSKAKSDVVLISGHDGGTGASPLTSLKHAGGPWELGLAETQQTLLLNDLRDRIVVQCDGQLKTGRDVMIAALLGAEEYGFATAPLVVAGCVMMRVCHLDTCPVGIATQNPELRERFTGQAKHVENFMLYVAEEVRELLASLGLRTLEEAIGHVELLDTRDAIDHWKASGLDLTPILHRPDVADDAALSSITTQDHGLQHALDMTLIEDAKPALERREQVAKNHKIRNVNRTVGTMLGHEVTKRFGGEGLPDDTIHFTFFGSAGQSFGAFVPKGITLRLLGDSNDYFGKGLSGGRLIVRVPRGTTFAPESNVIAGNVILYGATSGEAYINGMVGERFCVRNSGATAVVEGVGDHGCEYMTGGKVLIIGPTGRNFGAGMSGGVAYVYDPDGTFPALVNTEMVDLDLPDEEDIIDIHRLLIRHVAETGSAKAQRILEEWGAESNHFVKVMPEDYKRVLRAAEMAEERGLDVDEAIMAASH